MLFQPREGEGVHKHCTGHLEGTTLEACWELAHLTRVWHYAQTGTNTHHTSEIHSSRSWYFLFLWEVGYFLVNQNEDKKAHPHMPSARLFTTDRVSKKNHSEILSVENNNVALSTTDTICCREVEHGVRTCALWPEGIEAIYFLQYAEPRAVTKWSAVHYGKEERIVILWSAGF